MDLSCDGLLTYCTIGFAWLVGSFSFLIESKMAENKTTQNYFQAALYNSIRFSQISSFIFLCCSIAILYTQFFKPNIINASSCKVVIIILAELATTWIITIFTIYMIIAFKQQKKEVKTIDNVDFDLRQRNNLI